MFWCIGNNKQGGQNVNPFSNQKKKNKKYFWILLNFFFFVHIYHKKSVATCIHVRAFFFFYQNKRGEQTRKCITTMGCWFHLANHRQRVGRLPRPPNFLRRRGHRWWIQIGADRVFGIIARARRVHDVRKSRTDWKGRQDGRTVDAAQFRLLLLGGWAGRRVTGRRDGGSGSRKRFQLMDATSQVGEESLADCDVQAGGGGEIARHFSGAVSESSAEFVLRRCGRWWRRAQSEGLTFPQFMQMADRQFQHIGFLQFRQVFAFRRQSGAH